MDGHSFDEEPLQCTDCQAEMEWYNTVFICPECGLMLLFDGDRVTLHRPAVVKPRPTHTLLCQHCGGVNKIGVSGPLVWFLCDTCGKANARTR